MRFLLPLLMAAGLLQAQRQAPDLAIHMASGQDTHLTAWKGKVVLLALLNTGCPHCQHFAQELAGLQREYAPKGVQIVAVVFDKNAKQGLENFRQKYVNGFPLGWSDEVTVMNWLSQPLDQGYFVPIVVFINRRGQVVSQHQGDDILFQDPEGNIRHKLDLLVKDTRR